MAKPSRIEISEKDRIYFESLIRSRTMQAQVVQRARIILLKAEGASIDSIADKVGINKKSVMLCISKYKAGGAESALSDGTQPQPRDNRRR